MTHEYTHLYTVQELIQFIERDGWYTNHRHKQERVFHHVKKAGVVVINGSLDEYLADDRVRSILRQAGLG